MLSSPLFMQLQNRHRCHDLGHRPPVIDRLRGGGDLFRAIRQTKGAVIDELAILDHDNGEAGGLPDATSCVKNVRVR